MLGYIYSTHIGAATVKTLKSSRKREVMYPQNDFWFYHEAAMKP